MTDVLNPIAQLQEEIAGRLNADDYFSDITVITERQGDIENSIERALRVLTDKDGKIGIAAMVGVVSGTVESPNLPGPAFTDSGIEVTVFENPTFNNGVTGTGKAAVDVIVRVCQVMHHYTPTAIGQILTIDDQRRRAVEPLGVINKQGEVAYKTRIVFNADLQVLTKLLPPVISPAGGSVPRRLTITHPDAAAAIYYTTDLSYPWSGNTAATLYAGTFDITTASTLRAVAFKAAVVASDAAAEEYTA